VTGLSLKQAIVWTLVAALLVTVAATALLLASPDVAQAASDTSRKVGDEAKAGSRCCSSWWPASPRCR
jgi:hypothetical protein